MSEMSTEGRQTARYFLARDAEIIAKFVARVSAHEAKLAKYRPGGPVEFPRPIPKSAKWPAYEAAGRVERTLGLDTHAGSVPELATVAGLALAASRAR